MNKADELEEARLRRSVLNALKAAGDGLSPLELQERFGGSPSEMRRLVRVLSGLRGTEKGVVRYNDRTCRYVTGEGAGMP